MKVFVEGKSSDDQSRQEILGKATEIFEKYYPGQGDMIVDFWMPNKEWEGCNVNDPSARVLSNYGASGK